MKKSITILFLLIVLSSAVNKVVGQKFMAKPNMKRAYLIDTITIKNACKITYYPTNSSKIYDFSDQLIITNDSCAKEIQLKGLGIKGVYPNLGYYTLDREGVISLIFDNDIQFGTSKFDYMNADYNAIYGNIYVSDSMGIKKYYEPETTFYVFLLQANYFNLFYSGNDKIAEGNYVLVLLQKKPKQYIENNE